MKKIRNSTRFNFVLSQEDKENLYLMADSLRTTPSEFLRDYIKRKYIELNRDVLVQVITFKELDNAN
jgi:hypothetical protein